MGGGLSGGTFNSLAGAASDLFAVDAYKAKAEGNRLEAQEYDLASALATQNAQFTETSTAIQTAQQQRQVYQAMGAQRAGVASSGFASSGSALDLMRDSAAQGSLTKAVMGQQGLIEEAGYKEQAQSYQLMAQGARLAADANEDAASASQITGIIKGAGAVASLF